MSVVHECDRATRHGEPQYCLCETCYEEDMKNAFEEGYQEAKDKFEQNV